MSNIVRINKPIILKFEDREIKLPIELDDLENYKRPYLRDLIKEAVKY